MARKRERETTLYNPLQPRRDESGAGIMKARLVFAALLSLCAVTVVTAQPAGGLNPKAADDLRQILRQDSDPVARLRALWTLHSTKGLTEADALKSLKDADEYVRAWTIQLLCEDKNASEKVLKEFARLAREDKSPVVRLYLASVMQRLPVDDRWEVVAALSQHAEDANDHNLPLMVWYAAEPLPTRDFNRALALAENAKLPNLLNYTVRRTVALNKPEAFTAVTKCLLRVGDTARRLDILNGLNTALQGQRKAAMPAGWEEVEAKLDESPSAEIRALVQSLSLTFGSTRALTSLRATLLDKSADAAARKTAFDSLMSTKDAGLPPLLQQLLTDADLQGSALRGLAAYADAKTPDAILAVYSSLNAAHKRDALNTLCSRAAFASPLLTAIEAGKIPKTDLTADLVRQLRNLKNAEVDAMLT